jgi:hypothetical protein
MPNSCRCGSLCFHELFHVTFDLYSHKVATLDLIFHAIDGVQVTANAFVSFIHLFRCPAWMRVFNLYPILLLGYVKILKLWQCLRITGGVLP